MIFRETELKGLYEIGLEPREDERGFFARSYCKEEFKKHGLNFDIVQSSISYNKKKATLRGMHYQAAPHEEEKLVSCISGSIRDVVIDLRPGSPTYCKWFSADLSAKDRKSLYIPKGFAHGFQTMQDDTAILYHMSEYYYPECSRGIRWDDPFFSIEWPSGKPVISDKDKTYPFFKK